MSSLDTKFEVRVRNHRYVEMFHIDAKSHSRAKTLAKKFGHVVSIRKVDKELLLGRIEHLKLDEPIEMIESSPYESAIAMDELIWNKRNKRRENQQRDKIYH